VTGRQFWVDRGDTFTDNVARRPDGRLLTHKLLTDSPARYADAAVQGVRTLSAGSGDPVDTVRMGTRVATSALLERKAERTPLVNTRGFGERHQYYETLASGSGAGDGFFALSQHRRVSPHGVAGREPGALGAKRVEHAHGTATELGGSDSADVVTGDVLVIETPGGGGYGPPSPDPHQAGEEIDDLRAF
jgi:hypothetical protein